VVVVVVVVVVCPSQGKDLHSVAQTVVALNGDVKRCRGVALAIVEIGG
jgi:hypothetical protein